MKTIAQLDKPKTAPLRAVIPFDLFARVHHLAVDLQVRPNVIVIDALKKHLADLAREKDPAKARRAS